MLGLTIIDVKILKFVRDQGSVSMDDIQQKFVNIDSIEYRVMNLSTPSYQKLHGAPVPNSSYLAEDYEQRPGKYGLTESVPLGTYHLTTFGRKVLQDYEYMAKNAKWELWLKNAWIPIIVSFATTVITNYILPTLPQILKLLASTLSKIVS